MKTIWLILIGLVMFNGMILITTPFFHYSQYGGSTTGITNVTDPDHDYTKLTPGADVMAFLLIFGPTNLLATLGGIVIGILSKSFQYASAVIVAGFITSLWLGSKSVINTVIGALPTSSRIMVDSLYVLISIGIGIITAILIIGMLGQQDQG